MIVSRLPVLDPAARGALTETGAVILTGLPNSPNSLPVAASLLFGTSLRELFPHRTRRSVDGEVVGLHADSFDVVVDIAGKPVRRRHPDEDYVLVLLASQAAYGGQSFVLDAHEFTDSLDAELKDFLTGTDVDLYGRWANTRGLPATPRVGRHIEYTRTGRRITRRTDGVAALHRDPAAEHVIDMLARFDTEVERVQRTLPRIRLNEGELLVLDNYHCWHGRDAHTGARTVHIQTVRTDDA
ncbi:Taurine catabolism dioxygenase TauD, TfdA family [Lentzea waywayandensis]|uniref:Taurine catabolism dioxygenase TauD, TfdA family n=1 Tax=Lentzea waywayandensis TaxID=84724 RepID=A0A1I6DIP2_9PSEU|nr:TauD/TfdA family dioxygenase [Lentzea waywayandensis]SFR05304.1 Taurine catabolism dioxygenase TauD, TfdA family [Lentzea waywayandensis]